MITTVTYLTSELLKIKAIPPDLSIIYIYRKTEKPGI